MPVLISTCVCVQEVRSKFGSSDPFFLLLYSLNIFVQQPLDIAAAVPIRAWFLVVQSCYLRLYVLLMDGRKSYRNRYDLPARVAGFSQSFPYSFKLHVMLLRSSCMLLHTDFILYSCLLVKYKYTFCMPQNTEGR